MIKKNTLGRFKLLSSEEDQLHDGDDVFNGFERIPRNYPDGKRFIVTITETDGSISRYFAIKINGKVVRTASLVEV